MAGYALDAVTLKNKPRRMRRVGCVLVAPQLKMPVRAGGLKMAGDGNGDGQSHSFFLVQGCPPQWGYPNRHALADGRGTGIIGIGPQQRSNYFLTEITEQSYALVVCNIYI